MKKLNIFLLLFSISSLNFAENLAVKLDESVISGDGFYTSLKDTTKTIYTITASEISEKNIQSLPEALSNIPGVRIAEGFDGNGIIDIRGQGKQFNRNIAIIVDGVKMNPVDWGNVNLYTIPVDSIEKIEIIPSNASVIYGDNTVGGAINIVTKNQKNKNLLKLGAYTESHRGAKGNVEFSTTVNNTTFFGNYLNKKSNGYRENSFNRTENIQLGLNTSFNKNHSFLFKYGYNNTYKRLPDSLSLKQKNENRRSSAKPKEWFLNETNRFLAAYTYKKENLELIEQLSFQKVRADGNTNFKIKDIEQLDNTFKFKYLNEKNKFVAGIDYSLGKSKFPSNKIKRTDTKEAVGLFFSNTYSLTENLDIQAGFRHQRTSYKYSDNFRTSKIQNNKYTNNVFNIGAKYSYSDTGSTYLTFGKDFRTPLTREMVSSNGWYENIKPQEAYSVELGLRDFYKDTLISSSIFYSQTKDEIYFSSSRPNDPTFKDSGVNTNYDGKSEKFAYELFLERNLMDNLKISGTYSFLYTKFKTGILKGKHIPGTSKNKLTLGLNYKVNEKLNLNLFTTYYSSSYAWSDDKNNKTKVRPYSTVDLSINYQVNDDFKIYTGVKNLTNTKYYERVEDSSTKSNSRKYYPANERNYFVGFEYRVF